MCSGEELLLFVKSSGMSAGDTVVYSIAEKGTGNRGGKDNNGGGSGATLSGSYEVTKQDLNGGGGRNKKGKGGRKGRSGKGKELSVECFDSIHLQSDPSKPVV